MWIRDDKGALQNRRPLTQRRVCYFDVLGGFCLIHFERPISQALLGNAQVWGQRGVGVIRVPFKIAGLVTQSRVCYFYVLDGFCLIHFERPMSQVLLGIAQVWGQRGVSVDKWVLPYPL